MSNCGYYQAESTTQREWIKSDGKAIISECRMVSKRFYVQTGEQTERLLEWNTWHEICHHES